VAERQEAAAGGGWGTYEIRQVRGADRKKLLEDKTKLKF